MSTIAALILLVVLGAGLAVRFARPRSIPRAISGTFLLTVAIAAAGVVVSAMGADLRDASPVLVVAAILAGVVVAHRLSTAWPDGARMAWSVGVGVGVLAAEAAGVVVGFLAGAILAFATGLFVIGY